MTKNLYPFAGTLVSAHGLCAGDLEISTPHGVDRPSTGATPVPGSALLEPPV